MWVERKTFHAAKSDFQHISWHGHPFQSFENLIGLDRFVNRVFDVLHGRHRCFVYVVYDCDRPVLIAPLREIGDGLLEVAGSSREGFDYVDFIYAVDADVQASVVALHRRMKDDGYARIRLNYLCPNSQTPEYFQRAGMKVDVVSGQDNVRIDLAGNFDQWLNSLSKSVRQNIRTAYNRMHRDGLSFELQIYSARGEFGGGVLKNDAGQRALNSSINVYLERNEKRYGFSGVKHAFSVRHSQYPALFLGGEGRRNFDEFG